MSAALSFLTSDQRNEIRRRILDIAQAGADSRLGFLIGAGFSKDARDFPLGSELATRLMREATGSPDEDTVRKLVETYGLGATAGYYCEQATEASSLTDLLEKVLDSGGAKKQKSEAERHLASIVSVCKLPRIFTTNFDSLIEECVPAPRFVVVEPSARGLISFEKQRSEVDCTGVFHLNGTARDPKITEGDLKGYRPIFYEELKHELLTKVFVMVGYSFRDETISKVFDEVGSLLRDTQDPKREGRKTYLVMPVSNELEYMVAKSVWKSRGDIRLIPMGAAEFLRELESALGKLSYEERVKQISELIVESEQESDRRVDALANRLEAFTQADLAEVLFGLVEAGSE
jgi:hypothetical protein